MSTLIRLSFPYFVSTSPLTSSARSRSQFLSVSLVHKVSNDPDIPPFTHSSGLNILATTTNGVGFIGVLDLSHCQQKQSTYDTEHSRHRSRSVSRQCQIDIRFSPSKLEHELLTLRIIHSRSVTCLFNLLWDIGRSFLYSLNSNWTHYQLLVSWWQEKVIAHLFCPQARTRPLRLVPSVQISDL